MENKLQIISKSEIIITRVGYCPTCQKEERLKSNKLFMAYGSKGWHIKKAQHNSRYWGYVPHTYKLHKSLGENIIVLMCCAVQGCGCDWVKEKDSYYLVTKQEDYKRVVMTKTSWNALVLNPYRYDYDYFV